jgi:hypothetical protein
MHRFAHTGTCIHKCAHILAYLHVRTCARIFALARIHIHMHTYAHIRIYHNANIHTMHTCTLTGKANRHKENLSKEAIYYIFT